MAVLDAATDDTVKVADAPVDQDKKKRPSGVLPLPMIALGSLVVFAVGYGAGSLQQFDKDWRSAAPRVIETAYTQGGNADLADTVTAALAGAQFPVSRVVCGPPQAALTAGPLGSSAATGAAAAVAGQTQLCLAHSSQGMVSVVTQTAGQDVTITVFSGTR